MLTVPGRPASGDPFVEHRPGVSRERLAGILADTLERWPACRCALHERLSTDELVGLGAGCTSSRGFVCDRLAAVRRRCGL